MDTIEDNLGLDCPYTIPDLCSSVSKSINKNDLLQLGKILSLLFKKNIFLQAHHPVMMSDTSWLNNEDHNNDSTVSSTFENLVSVIANTSSYLFHSYFFQ